MVQDVTLHVLTPALTLFLTLKKSFTASKSAVVNQDLSMKKM